jgi:hypothetical protein
MIFNSLFPNPEECVFPGITDLIDLKVDLRGENKMDKICKNCKHWVWGHYHLKCCGANLIDGRNVYSVEDMYCPRWEAKEVEIPERLKKWVPVWHPISCPPKHNNPVLVISHFCWTAYYRNERWYADDTEKEILAELEWWTELP